MSGGHGRAVAFGLWWWWGGRRGSCGVSWSRAFPQPHLVPVLPSAGALGPASPQAAAWQPLGMRGPWGTKQCVWCAVAVVAATTAPPLTHLQGIAGTLCQGQDGHQRGGALMHRRFGAGVVSCRARRQCWTRAPWRPRGTWSTG